MVVVVGGDYIPRQKVESRFGEKSLGDLKVDSWSKNMMKGKGIEIVRSLWRKAQTSTE